MQDEIKYNSLCIL